MFFLFFDELKQSGTNLSRMLTMLLSANKHWGVHCTHMWAWGETTCNHDNLHCRRSAVRGSRNEHKNWPFVQNVKGVCLNPKRNQGLHPGTHLIQTICHPLRFISVPVSEGVKALNVRFQFDSRLPDDGWPNPAHMATHFCFEIVCFLYKLLLLLLML